jgi:hypothetical protein
MFKKIAITTVTLSMLLSGCTTLEEKLESKYGKPFSLTSYDGSTYKVLINKDKKELVVKEDDSVAEKLLSPKYGLIGVAMDAGNVFSVDEKYKSIADDFLSKNLEGCKTNAPGYKHFRECYEFQYVCSSLSPVVSKAVEIKKIPLVEPLSLSSAEKNKTQEIDKNLDIDSTAQLKKSQAIYLTCNTEVPISVKVDEATGKITHSTEGASFNAEGFFAPKTISYKHDLGIFKINRETLEMSMGIEGYEMRKVQCEIVSQKNNKI